MKKRFTLINKTYQRGFTLIELLVVSTIIIVLMSIGVVSYQAAQKKSRDSKRKSDLEQVRSALEMYRSDENSYPHGDWSSMINNLTGKDYLNSVPVDPKGYQYFYQPGSGYYTYTLCAYLEAETGGSCPGSHACGTETCNYQVVNP